MKLHLGNIATWVDFSEDDEQALREQGWLISFLSFDTPVFFTVGGESRHGGSTRRQLYQQKTGTFPAGLTAMVYRQAMAQGFQVEVIDTRKWPPKELGREAAPWLRDFQHDAVDRLLSRTRGIIGSPTGSGKTEVFCGLVLRQPTLRWLLLAPEADLMLNAADRYEKRTRELGFPDVAGRLGDGKNDTDHRVVAATFQTVSRRLSEGGLKEKEMRELLAVFQGVVVDECHQAPADSNFGVLTAMPNAFYRCGLSGTALARGDSRNIYTCAALGDTVYKIEPRVLMDLGFLARPTIRFVPHVIQPPKRKRFAGAYRESIVASKERNDLVVEIALQARKPCLVFVKHEAHGKEILKRLKARGSRAEFLYGKHSTEERAAAIKRLSWGDTEIAVCTKIWQTGTDIPELESMVIAKGGSSAIEAIQTVGRALRVVRDSTGKIIKGDADIWDIWDIDGKELNPDTGRMRASRAKWFEKHAKDRRLHYMGQGYPIVMMEEADCVSLGVRGKR